MTNWQGLTGSFPTFVLVQTGTPTRNFWLVTDCQDGDGAGSAARAGFCTGL